MTILIAEDDRFSRLLLKKILEKLGHDVLEAEHGGQAWDICQAVDVPLLISDWIMPEMDGLDLCKHLRARADAKYTYVILLTVMGGKGNYLDAIHAGADDVIIKPLDEDYLAARLCVAERILQLRDHNRQLARLIPICMYCKKARNDHDYWQQLDRFLIEQTDARLSHGICPDCFEKMKRTE